MEDLASLDWSNTNTSKSAVSSTASSGAYFASFRPTPLPAPDSGRNSALASQRCVGAASKACRPQPSAQDSFSKLVSNLVSFGGSKSKANLSLREQQQRQEAERRKAEEERRKQAQASYTGSFLDEMGQGQTPELRTATATPRSLMVGASAGQDGRPAGFDDNHFSALYASTKVDKSSHYRLPASFKVSPTSVPGPSVGLPSAWAQMSFGNGMGFEEDDDPFGLTVPYQQVTVPEDDDDDILGDLGKPVDQVRRKDADARVSTEATAEAGSGAGPKPSKESFDRVAAHLVDYSFTPESARKGSTARGAGINVQAAANWPLDDAHRGARRQGGPSSNQSRHSTAQKGDEADSDTSRRGDDHSPASGDGDFAKTAAAVGSNLFQTANNLWKTGQKKMQKAVAELQTDVDPNQPRWMRSGLHEGVQNGRQDGVTDEAMMLESGGRPERSAARSSSHGRPCSNVSSRAESPAKWQQGPGPLLNSRARINKESIEEQSKQAYVSPARRKKQQPESKAAGAPRPKIEPEQDLLCANAAVPTAQSTVKSAAQSAAQSMGRSPTPPSVGRTSVRRPPQATTPPRRQIAVVSPSDLQKCNKFRLDGAAHFKRGDYAAAHGSYTSSLATIPQSHPLAIILLCNRALTSLKIGQPRQAAEDADRAVDLIGPGKGEGEQVDLQNAHGEMHEMREMRQIYSKALTRKAEALEQMEKWADAAQVWQLCVQSGTGGPTAVAGRQRCQQALVPKPAVKAKANPMARPQPTQRDSEAVARLREANHAQEKEKDERFVLTDKVDARVAAWRDGKRDNLRALLGSLDSVLWAGSGWNKVGMHELVMANKVKICYMRAIAKTHPDKISQDASTEVRMIAAFVFSTLNEAWDKFKAEHGL